MRVKIPLKIFLTFYKRSIENNNCLIRIQNVKLNLHVNESLNVMTWYTARNKKRCLKENLA